MQTMKDALPSALPTTTATAAGRVLEKVLGRVSDPKSVDLLVRYAGVADLVEAEEIRTLQALDLHHRLTSRHGEPDYACALRLDLDARLACAAALGDWR